VVGANLLEISLSPSFLCGCFLKEGLEEASRKREGLLCT